jgi:hypothetical protein
MPVPGAITDLSETASSNSPAGSESVGTNANDYIQAAYAFIRQLYDGKWNPTQAVPMNGQKITGLADGAAATDAATVGQTQKYLGAPSGTRMVFQQAAAPTGWTVDASAFLQDCAMRFNAGAAHGGSAAWSSWNFGGTYTTDGTAISVAQMPSHNHADFGHNHYVNDPGHNHYVNDPGHAHANQAPFLLHAAGGGLDYNVDVNNSGNNARDAGSTYGSGTGIYLNASATGIYLNAAAANISYTGGGAAHTHTFRGPQVKYADCVVCVKS